MLHPTSRADASPGLGLLGLLALTVGCASPGPMPSVDLDPIQASVCRTGTVVLDPATAADRTRPAGFRIEAGTRYRLIGPGVSSLKGLPDGAAQARLCGLPARTPAGDSTFAPASFQLIDVDGQPAFSGILMGAPGSWRLEPTTPDEGTSPLLLAAPDSTLGPLAGTRVWVSGELERGTLPVHRIGPLGGE